MAPLPIIKSPAVVTGERALNAAEAVTWPVPPFVIFSVPPRVTAPLVAELGVKPVVPPEKVNTGDNKPPVLAINVTTPLLFLKNSFSSVMFNASSPAARLAANGTPLGVVL